MIFVTVGTHHQPFDRLVGAAASLVDLDDVVVQRGSSRVAAAGCHVVDHMPAGQWQNCVREARLVITHAGPASIFAAMKVGVPIVVPRRALWLEHVDDHQRLFVERMAERVRVVHNTDRLREAVVQALTEPQRPGEIRDAHEWCDRFEDLVDDVLMRRR